MTVQKLLFENTIQQDNNDHQDNSKRKKVTFTSIEIIELPYTVGDNPTVSSGVPLAASWIAQKRTTFDIEFFERYRPERRTKNQLALSKADRKALLLQSGHTAKEILFATQEAQRIKRQRFETLHNLRLRYRGNMIKPTQYGLVVSGASPPPKGFKQLMASPIKVSPRFQGPSRSTQQPYYHRHYHPEKQQQPQQQPPVYMKPQNYGSCPHIPPTYSGNMPTYPNSPQSLMAMISPTRPPYHPTMHMPKPPHHFPCTPPRRHPLTPPRT